MLFNLQIVIRNYSAPLEMVALRQISTGSLPSQCKLTIILSCTIFAFLRLWEWQENKKQIARSVFRHVWVCSDKSLTLCILKHTRKAMCKKSTRRLLQKWSFCSAIPIVLLGKRCPFVLQRLSLCWANANENGHKTTVFARNLPFFAFQKPGDTSFEGDISSKTNFFVELFKYRKRLYLHKNSLKNYHPHTQLITRSAQTSPMFGRHRTPVSRLSYAVWPHYSSLRSPKPRVAQVVPPGGSMALAVGLYRNLPTGRFSPCLAPLPTRPPSCSSRAYRPYQTSASR